MSYCQLCKSPTHGAIILCRMCISPLAERDIGHQIQHLLELITTPEVIKIIKQGLYPILRFIYTDNQEIDLSPHLSNKIKVREEAWNKSHNSKKEFKKSINNLGPIDVFPATLLIAIFGRRCYRRYLRSRFKYDPIRVRFLKGKGYPSSPRDEKIFRAAWSCFVFYSMIFEVCTNIISFRSKRWKEPAKGTELSEAIIEAVNAVERLTEYIPFFSIKGMIFPSEVIQEEGLLWTAAWAKTRINFNKHPRLKRRLSENDIDPNKQLREELPSNTLQAYYSADWRTLKELITKIANLVEHNGSERKPKEEFTDDLYQYNLTAPISSDPAHQIAVEDLLRLALEEAGLTDYEEAVWLLKSQGYRHQEIAQELGRSVDGVKKTWQSAQKKLWANSLKILCLKHNPMYIKML